MPFDVVVFCPLITLGLMGSALGCVVLWKRLTFAGEALSHGALFGVGLSFVTELPAEILYIIVCLGLSLFLGRLSLQPTKQKNWGAHLNSLSHGLLASGLLLLGFFPQGLAYAEMLLFGDLLALQAEDALYLTCVYLAGLIFFALIFKKLLKTLISQELLIAEGGDRVMPIMSFYGLLGVFVGVSVPLVGVFLLVGVMLLPSATAQLFAYSPRSMVLYALSFSVFGGAIGYAASYFFDLPMGPSVVGSHFFIYLIALCGQFGCALRNKSAMHKR